MSLTDSKRSKNYINKANENIKVAKVTKFDFKDFNKYKKRVYIGGESIKKVFPGNFLSSLLNTPIIIPLYYYLLQIVHI